MNARTKEITFGAMLIAIYGVLLLLNRQTGNLLEEAFLFILPLPMVIFSLNYGWKDSLPVMFCMAAITFLFGTFYTVFFAVGDLIVGTVLGSRLKSKRDLVHTQFLVMLLCALFSVLGSVVLASLIGIDLTAELTEMQSMMNQAFQKSGMDVQMLGDMLSLSSLMRMYIVSMLLYGVLQGFIIFRVSLFMCKRLRFSVPTPQPLGLYYPPKPLGYVALGLVILYMGSTAKPYANPTVQSVIQILGLCAYLFLMIFGVLAIVMFLVSRFSFGKLRPLAGLLALLLTFIFPYVVLFLGFSYLSLSLHDYLLGK